MIKHPEISKYRDLPIAAVNVTVPFHDVDIMQVVWHGHYIKYFEIARCAVLHEIDYDYPQMKESGYSWPVVDIRCRYVLPAAYGDRLEVVAIIVEWDIRLLIKYVVINKNTNQVLTRGQSVQVPLNMETMTMEIGCPSILQKKIENWLVNQ